MLSMLLYELEKGYSGYKMKHVGSGYGKWAGGAAAGVPGMVAGHYVGKAATGDRKDEKIDEKKKSHRVGAVADEQLRGKRLLKGAGIGAAIGAGLGALAKLANRQKGGGAIAGGAGLGALAGTGAASAIGGYKAGKRLGYGKLGRVGSAITPLTGLAKPKKISDSEKKKKK